MLLLMMLPSTLLSYDMFLPRHAQQEKATGRRYGCWRPGPTGPPKRETIKVGYGVGRKKKSAFCNMAHIYLVKRCAERLDFALQGSELRL